MFAARPITTRHYVNETSILEESRRTRTPIAPPADVQLRGRENGSRTKGLGEETERNQGKQANYAGTSRPSRWYFTDCNRPDRSRQSLAFDPGTRQARQALPSLTCGLLRGERLAGIVRGEPLRRPPQAPA